MLSPVHVVLLRVRARLRPRTRACAGVVKKAIMVLGDGAASGDQKLYDAHLTDFIPVSHFPARAQVADPDLQRYRQAGWGGGDMGAAYKEMRVGSKRTPTPNV